MVYHSSRSPWTGGLSPLRAFDPRPAITAALDVLKQKRKGMTPYRVAIKFTEYKTKDKLEELDNRLIFVDDQLHDDEELIDQKVRQDFLLDPSPDLELYKSKLRDGIADLSVYYCPFELAL